MSPPRVRLLLLLAAASGVGACTPQAELLEQRAALSRTQCAAAGFDEASDAYRLCLILQGQNQRLEDLERRLDLIELDQRRLFFPRDRFHYR